MGMENTSPLKSNSVENFKNILETLYRDKQYCSYVHGFLKKTQIEKVLIYMRHFEKQNNFLLMFPTLTSVVFQTSQYYLSPPLIFDNTRKGFHFCFIVLQSWSNLNSFFLKGCSCLIRIQQHRTSIRSLGTNDPPNAI